MAGESKIETKTWRHAVRRGWRTVKLMKMSEKSWPDRLFVKGPPLRIVFIEFKNVGEVPNAQQSLRHAELRLMGVEVYSCDSVEAACAKLGIPAPV